MIRSLRVLSLVATIAWACALPGQQPAAAPAPAAGSEPRLKNLRQLTHGGQNAEAYFSPDGKRIIFQSTRDGRQCDQIYMMNADGSGARMVSTGKGRTTCAFFLPDGKRFIYASTHETSPECPPPAPRGGVGYTWPVYHSYELYLADQNGKILRNLSNHAGYDAEATINWKTGKVVWTAMREGDLDLYSADLDGKNVKRLTSRFGYDGGGVYSADGKKLVWRAHYPKEPAAIDDYKKKLAQGLVTPMKMEIFVADADGQNARQVTSFGCASFAPYFTPDGKKIIFASNKHNCDGRFFELYLVNVDGTGLEQVTSSGGFSSFPMFSRDGKKLVFISDRNAKQRYEFNVFIADWQP
jgi:Tol biopolymer transport system component